MIAHALQLAAKRYLAVEVGGIAAGDVASTTHGLPQTVSDGGTANLTDTDDVPLAGGRALFFLAGEDNDHADLPCIICACTGTSQPPGDFTGNQVAELTVTIHYPADDMVDPADPGAGNLGVAAIAEACRQAVADALYVDDLPGELNAAREDADALTVIGVVSSFADRRFVTERGRAVEFTVSLMCAGLDLT
jgi:hypothetical protein